MTVLTELVGGPQDGKVALASASDFLVLHEDPRDRTLLDDIGATAVWNPSAQWYEPEALTAE